MTYRQAVEIGETILKKAGVVNPSYDTFALVSHVCRIDRTYYLMHKDEELSIEQKTEYRALLAKRVEHVPLQYLTEEQWFMGYRFKVNSSVLIPRQDTEILVEQVYKLCQDGTKVLDMCTGSGCVITSLKCMNPKIVAVGSDISKAAIIIAKENAKENHADVEFVCGNLFERVRGLYDIIVSNPPYIKSEIIATLDAEVKNYEPYDALDGKEDGLYFYRLIIEQARDYLKPNGWLCFEIGYDQGESVKEILKEHEYEDIRVCKDLAGLDRVVVAKAKR